jgi:uncharacterized protein
MPFLQVGVMNSQLHIPHEAITGFCRAHAVRELALFGSVIRGDFGRDSDVDVLIDLDPGARIGLIAFQKMRDELASILGRPVDLVTRAGLNRHIKDEILSSAEVVYAE